MPYVKNAQMCVECGDVRPRADLRYHYHAGALKPDGSRTGGKVCRSCEEDLNLELDYAEQCAVGAGVGEGRPAW